MREVTSATLSLPVPARDVLTSILRHGAQRMLAQAIEDEAAEWIAMHQQLAASGRRQVVRNGFMPERKIVTGLGEIAVKQPRVHDRRPTEEREHFTSQILPPYLRKTKTIEELIPWLYLKGISTGGGTPAGIPASTRLCRRCWVPLVRAFRRPQSRGSR